MDGVIFTCHLESMRRILQMRIRLIRHKSVEWGPMPNVMVKGLGIVSQTVACSICGDLNFRMSMSYCKLGLKEFQPQGPLVECHWDKILFHDVHLNIMVSSVKLQQAASSRGCSRISWQSNSHISFIILFQQIVALLCVLSHAMHLSTWLLFPRMTHWKLLPKNTQSAERIDRKSTASRQD